MRPTRSPSLQQAACKDGSTSCSTDGLNLLFCLFLTVCFQLLISPDLADPKLTDSYLNNMITIIGEVKKKKSKYSSNEGNQRVK